MQASAAPLLSAHASVKGVVLLMQTIRTLQMIFSTSTTCSFNVKRSQLMKNFLSLNIFQLVQDVINFTYLEIGGVNLKREL